MILYKRVKHGLARLTSRGDYGELPCEWDKTLRDEGQPGQSLLGSPDIVLCSQDPLALPVISHAASFQHGWQSDLFQCQFEVRGRGDGRKIGGGNSQLLEQLLFAKPILGGFQCSGRRKNVNFLGKKMD